jgi:formyltetrahydrofolate deformylase
MSQVSPAHTTRNSSVLLIDCPDARGLVASVAGFLYRHGANILHADQHRDDEENLFFMRVEWESAGFALGMDEFARAFDSEVARPNRMNWRVEHTNRPLNVAVLVSSHLHCYADLLHRHQSAELPCNMRLVISNHTAAAALAAFHGVEFAHIPVEPSTKADAERRQLRLLQESGVGLVVLARYMQVLSPAFVAQYPNRIINVHHSFLPAFSGAKPYHAAYRRGVKLIGATSHYVTDVLDDGPIIEQDVVRVSHRDQLADLVEKGRDVERLVLSRAVRWHLDHRILTYANKTVVFD